MDMDGMCGGSGETLRPARTAALPANRDRACGKPSCRVELAAATAS
jgi:hypothetical protein